MAKDIFLYNTMGRKKMRFEPQNPERITMYVCGPTVYAHAHIGNARPPVMFDVLFRLLRHIYGEEHVVYARNITDIDDKIINAANETGSSVEAVSEQYTKIYRDETRALNVIPPTLEPRATDHVDGMIRMMETLVAKGHAYQTDSGLFFHVPSMPDYGILTKRTREDMIAGARVEISDEKRDPTDFALWKAAKPGEPSWDSPWGKGRPGWHIECSAMIAALLGKTIDIHGGGIDLTFPHHENEIAQSCCTHDAPLANYWLHNGFLNMGDEKMSKSLGNVQLICDLLENWRGEIIRFALMNGHYRQPLIWTSALLEQSKTRLDRFYIALERLQKAEDIEPIIPEAILAALCDDLNTPKALAELSALANTANKCNDEAEWPMLKAKLRGAGKLLGLFQSSAEVWARGNARNETSDLDIDMLIAARNQARANKNWAEADRIRDGLKEAGIEIMDKADGQTHWRHI